MSRKKLTLNLGLEEKKDLTAIIRAKTSEQRMVERCMIILMTDDGKTLDEIAGALDISRATVNLWRQKFLTKRMEGLKDKQRPGRPRNFTSEERLKVIARACQKPENTTRWSTRDLAEALKKENLDISKSTVNRILLEIDLKPHKFDMWVTSRDPEFDEKCARIVGLYMNPPENALVISVDEKTGMQALGKKIPNKPMKPGYPEKTEFEYVRHGTQALIASFVVQSGEVFGKTYDRHTRYEFLDFIQDVTAKYPEKTFTLLWTISGPIRPRKSWSGLKNKMAESIFILPPPMRHGSTRSSCGSASWHGSFLNGTSSTLSMIW